MSTHTAEFPKRECGEDIDFTFSILSVSRSRLKVAGKAEVLPEHLSRGCSWQRSSAEPESSELRDRQDAMLQAIRVVQEPDLDWLGIIKPFLSVASSDASPHAC
jgi:hypothetical protein